MYISHHKQQELQLAYRLRRRRNHPWTGYTVFIVSGRNNKKATVHEGFNFKDQRKLKRLLRGLGYIN